MPGVRRFEFSARTRQLVAQRAGYRCSFPGCDRLTTGPGDHPETVSTIGQAAHIYGAAASGSGPRGTHALTGDELRSSENAIWLCADHASLIDKHGGRDYPAARLHSFKSLHESRIAHELRGYAVPFGWVDGVTIHSSPLLTDSTHIDLAKLNLVLAGNSVGKTALCEWIAGHVDASHLERWQKVYPPSRRRLRTEMRYHDPQPHRITVDFRPLDFPLYALDDEPTMSAAGSVKAVFPRDLDYELREQSDDLAAIAAALGLAPLDVRALCDSLGEEDDWFGPATFEENQRTWCLEFQVPTAAGRVEARTLRELSGSELFRLVTQLGIRAANTMSAIAPTVLILDAGFWRLDTSWLRRYAEVLASPNCRFQTIASTHGEGIDFKDVTWSGWQIIHLDGNPPSVTVTTGFGGPGR